uniref:Uncharacterized protein n=1 Tax=Kalanchoe fedtschenkoi TaxID=63787 RepID=A0A7N0TJM9_KALFE
MAPRIGGFKPEALEIVTDGFCEDNCIARFQFEKSTAGMSPKVRGAHKLSENSSEGAIIIWSSSGFCFFLMLHTQSTGVLRSNPVSPFNMQRK